MGNGGCGQFITCCFCYSFLLTVFPCSNVGSHSQQTVLHKLLQRESFSRAIVLHKLPQSGSLPWHGVLQEQTAPVWVPHGVTSPVSKPAPAWVSLSLSTGPQMLPGLSSSLGFPQGHNLLWASTCPSMSPPWASCGDLLHHGPPRVQGHILPHHGLLHGFSSMGSSLHRSTGPSRSLLLQGLYAGSQPPSGIHLLQHGVFHVLQVVSTRLWTSIGCRGTSAPAPGAPPSPPSSLTLVFAELFLSHYLTPLSIPLQFFPLS